MSAGMMLLTIAAVLVFCGLLQRVLDRMYLTDCQALAIIGAMLLGMLLPDITLGPVSVNLGGAVIPLLVCGFMFVKADTRWEKWRTIIGTLLTAAAVCALSVWLPAEAETLPIDPLWLYGLCGGVIAWVIGRSRRAAFVCGVAGLILADVLNSVVASLQGYQTELVLGGGGIADAAVVSGVIAVLMCELIGEVIERIVCSKRRSGGHIS